MLQNPSPRLLTGSAPSLTHRGTVLVNNPSHPRLVYDVNNVPVGTASLTLGNLGEEDKDRTLICVGYNTDGNTIKSATWCGQALRLHYEAVVGVYYVHVISGRIPRGTTGPLVFTMTNSFFGGFYTSVYTATGLASDIPIATGSQLQVAATVGTIDLATTAGGFIVAGAFNNVTAAQNCTWSGDQTPTEISEYNGGPRTTWAYTTNTNNDSVNTITATWDVVSTTVNGIVGASFR